jgi:VIT1/CCC1 family predicted Fe2+/Mn2+ transporter
MDTPNTTQPIPARRTKRARRPMAEHLAAELVVLGAAFAIAALTAVVAYPLIEDVTFSLILAGLAFIAIAAVAAPGLGRAPD